MSYTYLASPYSHPDRHVRAQRYDHVILCTYWLIKRKIWTFSPIVHCQEIAIRCILPTDWAYWHDYNMAMLRPASRLLILTLEGWQDSRGVQEETMFAHDNGIPIEFIAPHVHTITKEPT
jgi:Domain of unknown function (DUF1937)